MAKAAATGSRAFGTSAAVARLAGHQVRATASATTRPDLKLPRAASSTASLGGSSRASSALAVAVIASAVFGRRAATAAQAAVVHGETYSGRAWSGGFFASGAAVRP